MHRTLLVVVFCAAAAFGLNRAPVAKAPTGRPAESRGGGLHRVPLHHGALRPYYGVVGVGSPPQQFKAEASVRVGDDIIVPAAPSSLLVDAASVFITGPGAEVAAINKRIGARPLIMGQYILDRALVPPLPAVTIDIGGRPFTFDVGHGRAGILPVGLLRRCRAHVVAGQPLHAEVLHGARRGEGSHRVRRARAVRPLPAAESATYFI